MLGLPPTNSLLQERDKDALLGRLRINGKLRCAPPPRPEHPGPGRPKKHGEILHPGWDSPEISPDEEIISLDAFKLHPQIL